MKVSCQCTNANVSWKPTQKTKTNKREKKANNWIFLCFVYENGVILFKEKGAFVSKKKLNRHLQQRGSKMKHWFFRTNFHVLSRYRIGKMTMLFLCLKRKVQKKSVGACTVCAIWGRSKFSSFSQPRKRWFGPILFSRKHRTPNASFPPTMTRRCAQLSWCFLKRKKSVQSQQQQWRKRDEPLLQVITNPSYK